MGYSLSKMADFQNRLISWIFGVFSSGYLHRTTLMGLYNRFSHVFGIFNFWPKLTILQRLWPLQRWQIYKIVSFMQYLMVFEAFFCTEALSSNSTINLFMFSGIWNFYPNWPFCQDYSLYKRADFKNRLISRIFGVFSSGFLHRTTLMFL